MVQEKRKEASYEFHYFHNFPQEEHNKKEHQKKKKIKPHSIEGILVTKLTTEVPLKLHRIGLTRRSEMYSKVKQLLTALPFPLFSLILALL